MPDTPDAPIVVGKTPPPQPEVEAPPTIAEAIQEVVKEAEEKGEIAVEEGDAVPVGEAETLDVGEQAGDGEEVGEGGEEETGESVPEAEQPTEEASEGKEEEAEPDLFTVKLPPRRDGEDPIELDLENLDEEAQEGFRRLMNEGMRREQADAAMDQARSLQSELQDVLISMDVDPINFIRERTTPEVQIELARHLLSINEIYEKVVPEVAGWDRSPEVREAAMARLERDRILATREAETILAQKAESRKNAADIYDHVRSLVPENVSEEVGELFIDQGMRVIQQYAMQNQVQTMNLGQIEPILRQTHVFRLLEAQSGVRPTVHPTEPSSAVPAKPAATDTSLREAEETAKRFQSTSARKRNAAAVAPPGAGPAPVQPPQPPEEVQRSVKESIKWYRKNVLRR